MKEGTTGGPQARVSTQLSDNEWQLVLGAGARLRTERACMRIETSILPDSSTSLDGVPKKTTRSEEREANFKREKKRQNSNLNRALRKQDSDCGKHHHEEK